MEALPRDRGPRAGRRSNEPARRGGPANLNPSSGSLEARGSRLPLPYELFIALRYLRAKRKQTFVSLITFISIAGVAVGVMALTISLALMTAFEQDIQRRILSGSAHLTVF